MTARPAPLHPARLATVLLPAPTAARHGRADFAVWQPASGDSAAGWRVQRDEVGDLVAVPPRHAYVQTSREREQWRAFALAVLAATQVAPLPAGATENVPSPAGATENVPSPAGATQGAASPAGATAGTTTA